MHLILTLTLENRIVAHSLLFSWWNCFRFCVIIKKKCEWNFCFVRWCSVDIMAAATAERMQICVSVKPNGCEIKWENTSGINTTSEQFEWFFSQTTKTTEKRREKKRPFLGQKNFIKHLRIWKVKNKICEYVKTNDEYDEQWDATTREIMSTCSTFFPKQLIWKHVLAARSNSQWNLTARSIYRKMGNGELRRTYEN